jgi:hypothetical protein
MRADVHDRLELPVVVPTASRSGWEKNRDLQQAYNPMLERSSS